MSILHYLLLHKYDLVMIGSVAQPDALLICPFAKLRVVTIAWDAFLSPYEMVVQDRKSVCPKHLLAKLHFVWGYLSRRAANLIVLDKHAHADYFVYNFDIEKRKVGPVFFGVKPEAFRKRPETPVQKYAMGAFL